MRLTQEFTPLATKGMHNKPPIGWLFNARCALPTSHLLMAIAIRKALGPLLG